MQWDSDQNVGVYSSVSGEIAGRDSRSCAVGFFFSNVCSNHVVLCEVERDGGGLVT